MALDSIIFDVDGTLVDTNPAHVEAWERAFQAYGYKVARDRIAVEIGKGGDLLVADVLGQQAEEEHGDDLRQADTEEYLQITKREHFRVFPGVRDLIRTLRQRGLRVALATSSKSNQLEATLRSAGLEAEELGDMVITASEAQTSKPAPDLVIASVRKQDLCPAQCAMVGDTPYDAEACKHAGVVCLGLLCGGNKEKTLRQAGVRGVWQDAADLLAHLDEALAIASPGPHHVTWDLLDTLMTEAVAAAREGLGQGALPFGAVLARSDGDILGHGCHDRHRRRHQIDHALMVALNQAKGKIPSGASDLILVSTLEPCIMCTGAALEMNVDTIVYGLTLPVPGGTRRVVPSEAPGERFPRLIGQVLLEECRSLLKESLAQSSDPNRTAFLQALLK